MQVLTINLQDGLGHIEIAVNSHEEVSRLLRYLAEADIALQESVALKEQGFDKVYQYLTHYNEWQSCTSEQYRRSNGWGKTTRVLFTRPETGETK